MQRSIGAVHLAFQVYSVVVFPGLYSYRRMFAIL
jgi:hypothetical protein